MTDAVATAEKRSEKVTLPESPGETLTGDPIRLDLDEIWIDNDENVRKMDLVSEDEIESLAASIYGQGGLLQGLGVVKIKPKEETLNRSYGLMFGFRRSAALKYLAGIHGDRWTSQIPCTVVTIKSVSDFKIAQLAENLQRSDLNPIEKATALKEALEDKRASRNQKEIAAMVGLSDSNVSQLLNLTTLPVEVQEMMQGIYRDKKGELVGQTLSFSHARLIMYHIPVDKPDKRIAAAKVGLGKTYDQFKKYIESKWGDSDDGDGGSDDSGSGGSQRSARLLTASDLDKCFIPFVKEKAKAASEDKKYSAKDVWARILDTLKTVQRDSETALSKEIAPYLKEQAAKEEEERAQSDAKKMKDKWFKDKVKFVNELMDMPPNTEGKRPYPQLSDAMTPVLKKVEEMSDEAIEALGFPVEKEKFAEELMAAWSADRAAKLTNKKKREEAKAKKEAEAKEKEAAAKKKADVEPEEPESVAAPAAE